MVYRPVWVSTIKHLDGYKQIIKNTLVLNKIVGRYNISPGFPSLELNYNMKMPIVYFSSGQISVDERSIQYESLKNNKSSFKNYTNIQDDLVFKIDYSDIIRIERYRHNYTNISYYSINWIRIVNNSNFLDEDILICVGGTGPLMNSINSNTNKLFELIDHNIKK